MDNITIVNSELYNITGIGVKKIKLDGNKLMAIKEKGVLRKPVVEKERIKVAKQMPEEITNPVMDFSPKVEEEIDIKPSFRGFSSFDVSTPAYNATKREETIDLKPIKDLENTYKGTKEVKEPQDIETKKEEKKETLITEEMFLQELNKTSFSPEATKFKDNLRNEYNKIKIEIENQKKKIDSITKEYAKESETINLIKEEKKDIQKVLNGMNAWEMDFFAKFKNEQRTRNLISGIEDYFSSFRKDLEARIQAEKSGELRKETLGKTEQKEREVLIELNKNYRAFIQKNYSTLIEVNAHDEVLRKNKEEIKNLTGYKETDLSSLHLNSERYSEPDIPKINEGNSNTASSNLFDVLRRSTPDVESTQELKIPDQRKTVTNISNEIEQDFSFRRVA